MKKKGYALPIAVFTGIFIITMLFILFNIVINQITISKNNQDRASKEYLIEAAKEEAKFELLSNIQRDINATYDVSYKTTKLQNINGKLPNGEEYVINFSPNQIEYNLEKSGDKFMIKSLKNNVFIVALIDTKRNEEINYIIELEIKDGKISYLIKE